MASTPSRSASLRMLGTPSRLSSAIATAVRTTLSLVSGSRRPGAGPVGAVVTRSSCARVAFFAREPYTVITEPYSVRSYRRRIEERIMEPMDPRESGRPGAGKRICVIGASGRLGRYMVRHALQRGYEVVGVCREKSVRKLAEFEGRITLFPGQTDDREVVARAVEGCDAVLTVLVPWGMHHYSSGTAQAVLDHARPGARLVFSCGWHITRDGEDVYDWKIKAAVNVGGRLAKLLRLVDLDDQVEACRRIFASDTAWTVVRGSDLEEGPSEGLPVW